MIVPGVTVTVRINNHIGQGDCLGQAMEMLTEGILESGDKAMSLYIMAEMEKLMREAVDQAETEGWVVRL